MLPTEVVQDARRCFADLKEKQKAVTPEMMYHYFPYGEFDRMDPVAGQACRDASLGSIPKFGVEDTSPVDGEIFSEVSCNRQRGARL